MRTVIVSSGGLRLDQFLAEQEGVKSRVRAASMIKEGHVRVRAHVTKKPSTILAVGDTVTFLIPENRQMLVAESTLHPLPILYEDRDCFVINKPAGIAMHPGHGMKEHEATILSCLQPLFSTRSLPFLTTDVLVHRLDKDTTGCVLVAKNPAAHLRLQKQFSARTIGKMYLALVYGVPSPSRALIDAPIGRHATQRTRMSVASSSRARHAQTTYRTLATAQQCSLLACQLHTGRTHQIRVHLSTIGHPLLGDRTYESRQSKATSHTLHIDHPCLHAWKLQFIDSAGATQTITAPPPRYFIECFEHVGIEEKKLHEAIAHHELSLDFTV